MSLLEKIFSHFTVIIVRMAKDGDADVFPVEVMRRKREWIAGQPLQEISVENAGGSMSGYPVLVVLTGYGVIRKVYGVGKSEEMERITGSEEFIWDRSVCGGGEQAVCFARRDRITPLLEKFDEERVPVVDVYVAGNGETIHLQDTEEGMREMALSAASRFYRERLGWKKLTGGGCLVNVLSGVIVRKIRLPLLVCLLFLLFVNYMWNSHVREAYGAQQQDLVFWEKDAASREKLSEKTIQLLKEFRGNGQVQFSLLFDRIAALVPPEITLETLAVNPLLKSIEEKKPLVIREGYIVLTGFSAVPGKVTAFTGALSKCDFARQVELISLDRSQETGLFYFNVLIGL